MQEYQNLEAAKTFAQQMFLLQQERDAALARVKELEGLLKLSQSDVEIGILLRQHAERQAGGAMVVLKEQDALLELCQHGVLPGAMDIKNARYRASLSIEREERADHE